MDLDNLFASGTLGNEEDRSKEQQKQDEDFAGNTPLVPEDDLAEEAIQEDDEIEVSLRDKMLKSMKGRLHSEIPVNDEYWYHLNAFRHHVNSTKKV